MHWHCDQKRLWPITCISIIALPTLLSVIAVLWGINAFRSNFAVRHDDRDLVLLSNVFWDIYSVISSLQVLNTNGSVRGNNCDIGTRAPNLQMNWKSKIKFADDKKKCKEIKEKFPTKNICPLIWSGSAAITFMNSDLCGFLTIPTETKDILACSKIMIRLWNNFDLSQIEKFYNINIISHTCQVCKYIHETSKPAVRWEGTWRISFIAHSFLSLVFSKSALYLGINQHDLC